MPAGNLPGENRHIRLTTMMMHHDEKAGISAAARRLKAVPVILIAALVLLLAGSIVHKAAVSSFTHDESFTWNHYVTAPVQDILTFKTVTPNNHLLNTLLMKAVSGMFGSSEIVLRLPNILAFLGFVIFTLLLLRKLDPWLILPVFTLVNCNPYLMDFFALARGNGLSYCFLMGSIFFFTVYAGNQKIRLYAWSVFFAFLGLLSHLTMLYFLLSLMIAANLLPLLNRYFSGDRTGTRLPEYLSVNLVNLAVLLLTAAVFAGPVRRLVAAGQLYYGGESGFWKDTAGSLIETFFYGMGYAAFWQVPVKIFIAVVVLAATILLAKVISTRNRKVFGEYNLLFIVFLLMMLTVLINISQFYLLGTKLLIRRYGLLFIPMFMLCSGLLPVFLIRATKRKTGPYILLYAVALAFAFHTFHAFSGTAYLDWDYDRDTRKVMSILGNDIKPAAPPATVTLGIPWVFEPSVNFYRTTRNLSWLKPANREGPAIKADYYYVSREDMTLVPLQGGLPGILFDNGKTILVKIKGRHVGTD